MKVHNRALFTEVQEDAISVIESTPRSMYSHYFTPRSHHSYDQAEGEIKYSNVSNQLFV